MSGTYYCHECEARRLLTPISTCTTCGCRYIEEIPAVIDEDDEEEFNRELDFFFIHEGQEDNDDDEELLEERCLYEQLSSIYNHPIARDFDHDQQREQVRIDELLSTIADNSQQQEEEEQAENNNDIVAYDVLFEQRSSSNTTEEEGSRSIFQLPFARIGRLLDTMYSFGSDEESENGGDDVNNYNRRSFLDNLADILSDYTQDIETTALLPANNSPPLEVILSSFKKKILLANDPDVEDECIICQDTFGTTLEIFYLPCHHKFHGECISRWLCVKTSCPVCRQPAHQEIKSESAIIEEDQVMETAIHESSSISLQNDTIEAEDFVDYVISDQDLLNRRDRLQRLRQELVSRRNHWLSLSPITAPPPTFNDNNEGEFFVENSHILIQDSIDRTTTMAASSMEEVD